MKNLRTDLVLVTGTDGKTTTVETLSVILRSAGWAVASAGSLGICEAGQPTGDHFADWAGDARSIAGELMALSPQAEPGQRAAILVEMTSYWLSIGVAKHLCPSAVAITSLGHDHLDLHETLAAYHKLKATLLNSAPAAVLGPDVPDRLAELGVRMPAIGTHAIGQMGTTAAATNHVIAATLAQILGVDEGTILTSKPAQLQGRMEFFAHPTLGPRVIVDSAHTPQAMTRAITEARHHTKGRILAVAGAGGSRDTSKRVLLGEALAHGADKIIVTDDNPRIEEAAFIRHDILEGCPDALEIAGRADAVREALRLARALDVVLLLGMGHEGYSEQTDYPGDRAFLKSLGFESQRHPNPLLDSRVLRLHGAIAPSPRRATVFSSDNLYGDLK